MRFPGIRSVEQTEQNFCGIRDGFKGKQKQKTKEKKQ